ncbi:hypothetical protein GOP47_0010503, partial [Adiantum capillus-veneris]
KRRRGEEDMDLGQLVAQVRNSQLSSKRRFAIGVKLGPMRVDHCMIVCMHELTFAPSESLKLIFGIATTITMRKETCMRYLPEHDAMMINGRPKLAIAR